MGDSEHETRLRLIPNAKQIWQLWREKALLLRNITLYPPNTLLTNICKKLLNTKVISCHSEGKKKQTVALRLPKCHKENMINKHEPYRLNIEQRKLKVRRIRRKKKKVGGVVTKKQKVPRNL